MSGLCGWAGYAADEEARRDLLARMAAPLARQDQSALDSHATERSALATGALFGNATLARDGEFVVAIAGRPSWTDPALAETAGRQDHAHALALGFRNRGRAVLDSLRGTFALAVVHRSGEEALLAVDRMGTWPLYFRANEGALVFGTSGLSVQAHPAAESAIDPDSIFHYFFFHQVPAPRSIRQEQERLLPGCFAHWRGGRVETGAYHTHSFRPEERPLDELKEEFLSLVRAGVQRAAAAGRTGAFLSGGTDSSTVAGMLAQVVEGKAKTYSIGFAAEGYDEMEYARCASERFDTDQHEYYVTPEDVVAAVPGIAAAHSNPFANESAVPTYFCARMAREDGIECLLAGDGGDELFGGNERYATQGIFGLYDRTPRPLRALLRGAVFGFPFGEKIWPVRKARSYIRQASLGLPERLYTYNLVLRLGAANIFEPEFLERVDPRGPLRLAERVWASADAQSVLNRMLALDFKFTLADNDLQKVNQSCTLAGVEVAYPLMTDELTEFSMRLPDKLKLKGSQLRWFFKWALRDLLPEKILRKSKHGFGLPFGVWLKTHPALQQLAADSLSDLKQRRIVRPAFMEDLLRLHRDEHASFYGVMVWTLIMLEQWFKVHEDKAAVAV